MSKLKALDENLNLTDKRIILRVDLNVPTQEGKITDKFPKWCNKYEKRVKIVFKSRENEW